jgi:hypothetical protein
MYEQPNRICIVFWTNRAYYMYAEFYKYTNSQTQHHDQIGKWIA